MTTATPVSEADLTALVAGIFAGHGVPAADAHRVAECLVLADLRGVGSHGVSRVPIYTERLRRGLVKARPEMRLERALSVAARLDATMPSASSPRPGRWRPRSGWRASTASA